MKNFVHKLLAFLMVLIMLFDASPVSALAEALEGAGDQAAPIVTDAAEPQKLSITLPKEQPKEALHTLEAGEYTVTPVEVPPIELSVAPVAVPQTLDNNAAPVRGLLKAAPLQAEETAADSKTEQSDLPEKESDGLTETHQISGSVAYEISLTENAATNVEQYIVPVDLSANPVDLLSGVDDKENAEITKVSYTLYHIHTDSDGQTTVSELEQPDVDRRNESILGFSFKTDSFSTFVLSYTVDFVYIEKKTEISIDLGNFQANSNELGQLLYKNSKGLEELAVSDILDFAQDYLQDENVCGEVYTVSLQNGTALSDFDQNFFANSAVSIEGKGIEYGSGKITLLESFDEAKITFASEAGTLELTLENYTAPEKPVVPETEDGFAYRFFGESATVADILTANEIVSSYYDIVSLSDGNLVSVDGDKLTVNNYFGEIVLILSLSDGTEVEIKLSNPAPIEAGETVTGEDGNFSADTAVPAGTTLSVKSTTVDDETMAAVQAAVTETLGEAAQPPVFFDISLVGPQGEKLETGATVTAKVDLPLPTEEGKVTKVTGVKVFHVTESGVEALDATYTLGEGKISAVSFETLGFSVFGISYTVEFIANGHEYSMPGDGVLLLSTLFSALGIEEDVVDVENISFTNPSLLMPMQVHAGDSLIEKSLIARGYTQADIDEIKNGLYAAEEEDEEAATVEGGTVLGDDWALFSLQSFNTDEILTVTMKDGTVYKIAVSDPPTPGEQDIKNMLTDVSLLINGQTATEPWQVEAGQEYDLRLTFTESMWRQFNNSGTMVYKLPPEIKTTNTSGTFPVSISMYGRTYTLPGNTWTLNERGELRIQWNTSHPMYRYLLYSGSTIINVDIKGMFTETPPHGLKFSDTITKTVDVNEPHDVGVTKRATYDKNTQKIHYVVEVSSKGKNNNVTVTDALGSALTLDQSSLTVTSNKNPAPKVQEALNGIQYTNDGKGFSLTFNDNGSAGDALQDGEVITIEYDAMVDCNKIGKSGNATFDETGNQVDITYPDDDTPGNNTATTVEHNISFSDFDKSVASMSGVQEMEVDGRTIKYKDITWTITTNTDHSIALGNSTIKDFNNSSGSMWYITSNGDKAEENTSGNFLHVEYSGTRSGSIDVPWSALTNNNAYGWTYLIPNEEPHTNNNLQYTFTYKTRVSLEDGTYDVNVQNGSEGKGGGDSEYVPVWSGVSTPIPTPTATATPEPTPTGQTPSPTPEMTPTPTPEPTPIPITANKSVKTANTEYIDWAITVIIPEEGYTEDFFIVDYLPNQYFSGGFHYDTYDEAKGIKVSGLTGGEFYQVTNDTENHQVKIQFYQQENDKGLNSNGAGNGSRLLTVELRTLVNQEWLEFCRGLGVDSTSYYWDHTNNATITANGATADVSATASPRLKYLNKEVVNGTLQDVTIDGVTRKAYAYRLKLGGVNSDQIVINDVFDTSVLKAWDAFSNNPYSLVFVGGGQYGPGSLSEDINGQTVNYYSVPTVENTANGARYTVNVPKKEGKYFEIYYFYYYLYVDNMENLIGKTLSNGGTTNLVNTAHWENLSDDATVTFSYQAVSKTAQDVYDDQGHVDKNYEQYTITLNPEKIRMNGGRAMTMTDTFNNLAIDYATIQITTDPAANASLVTYDYSGNVGTYQIPDETAVTITYRARITGERNPDGSGTVTYSNTAEMMSFMETHSDTTIFTSADVNSTGGSPSIKLMKYGEYVMGSTLSGAVFQLYDGNKTPLTYPDNEWTKADLIGQPITFRTAEQDITDLNDEVIVKQGYVLVQLNQNTTEIRDDVAVEVPMHGMNLERGVTYYLREVTAPTGYAVDGTFYKFIISENNVSDYDNYIYVDGDILKVRDFPKQNELNLEKAIAGIMDMTEEQRSSIRFLVQSVDPATGEPNGAYTRTVYFNNFVLDNTDNKYKYKLEDIPDGTYKVTEYAGDVFDLKLVGQTIVRMDDDSASRDDSATIPFVINSNPDNGELNQVMTVGYRNTYKTQHTYYFTKVEQGSTSIKLPGVVFTAYKYVDGGAGDQLMGTYTTDMDGQFRIFDGDGKLYEKNTLYYVVETATIDGYVMPDPAPKYYYYFGGTLTTVPSGVTPVNLGIASQRQTVTNEPITMDIPVEKVWGTGTVMPASIEVKLYRRMLDSEGTWQYTGRTMTLQASETASENWKGVFDHLSIDYEYKVVETIPDGAEYTATYASEGGDGVVHQYDEDKTITITNTSTRLTISARKVWTGEPMDDPNSNYSRPAITLRLQFKLPTETNWTLATLSNIRSKLVAKYNNNSDYWNYQMPGGYSEERVIAAVSAAELTSYDNDNLIVTWEGLPNEFVYRVVEVDSSGTVKENDDIYFIDSSHIYKVTYDNAFETGLTEGQATITNENQVTSISFIKRWVGNGSESTSKVTVSLYRDALPEETPNYTVGGVRWILVIDQSNTACTKYNVDPNVRQTFDKILKGYTYHLVESDCPSGYIYEVSNGNLLYGGETATITNIRRESENLVVEKRWFDNDGNELTANLPQSVTVKLKQATGHYDGVNVKIN